MFEDAFRKNIAIRDPHIRAQKVIESLPSNFFYATTDANVVRMQEAVLKKPVPELPPVLFHCTSASSAVQVLKEGLKPRELTGKNNYGEPELHSHPELVYLTDTNLNFYLSRIEHGNQSCAFQTVLKIDTTQLDPALFYPDEDYAALLISMRDKSSRSGNATIAMTRDRIEEFKHLAHFSLAGYGNIAYRGVVPPSAIQAGQYFNMNGSNLDKVMMDADYLLMGYPFLVDDLKAQRDTLIAAMFEKAAV
jgi:hypothetical protein